ncbi:MAG: hypothetical protein BA871_13400 [Desulfuromonadales bacterium C00003096]|jgi:hypothetical protein|nr:MAG: hypothetical protein BA871_13400 [Desulfuromonadales bacterium C00003096]
MEEGKIKEGEEDVVKAMKILVESSLIPLKVAVDVVGNIAESVEDYIPKPSKLASDLIGARVTALKAISKIVDKEVELLEKYKDDLEVSDEKKEKVTVE